MDDDDPGHFLTPWYGAAAQLADACISVPKGMAQCLSPQDIRKVFSATQRASLLATLYASVCMAERTRNSPAPVAPSKVGDKSLQRSPKSEQARAAFEAAPKMVKVETRRICHLLRSFTPEEFMPASQQTRSHALGARVLDWGGGLSLDWPALSGDERVTQLAALASSLSESDGLGAVAWEPATMSTEPLISQASPQSPLRINAASEQLGDFPSCVEEVLQQHQGRYQLALMQRLLRSGPRLNEDESWMAKVFTAAHPISKWTPAQVAKVNAIDPAQAQEWIMVLPQAVHARGSTDAVLDMLEAAGPNPETASSDADGVGSSSAAESAAR